MNWYIVRDAHGRMMSAHISGYEARQAMANKLAAKRICVYDTNVIVGWTLAVVIFGGIGLMLAY